ncbi:MAG: respiratory nitrate reductase subunit gamma, partial [Deltaproteobacteria bacterium]
MKALASAILVLTFAALAFAAAMIPALRTVVGVALPYAAMLIFFVGIAYRVIRWANAPVPFRIPVTSGQEKSLPWLKSNRIDNPSSRAGAFARVALEVLIFRSLFRNTQAELRQGPRLLYGENKFLWLAALAFHWSLLVVLLRHLRFFLAPVPRLVMVLEGLDAFLQVSAPGLLLSDVVLLAGLLFLLVRRFTNVHVRTISLYTDYFALFLLLGIAISGVLMR